MDNTLITTTQDVPTSSKALTIWVRLSLLPDSVRAIFIQGIADNLGYAANAVYTYLSDDRTIPAAKRWGLDIDRKKTLKKHYKRAFCMVSGLPETAWEDETTYLFASIVDGKCVYSLEDMSGIDLPNVLSPLIDNKNEL